LHNKPTLSYYIIASNVPHRTGHEGTEGE